MKQKLMQTIESKHIQAMECVEAERLACLGLSGKPPIEIRAELRDVLMMIWQPTDKKE